MDARGLVVLATLSGLFHSFPESGRLAAMFLVYLFAFRKAPLRAKFHPGRLPVIVSIYAGLRQLPEHRSNLSPRRPIGRPRPVAS